MADGNDGFMGLELIEGGSKSSKKNRNISRGAANQIMTQAALT